MFDINELEAEAIYAHKNGQARRYMAIYLLMNEIMQEPDDYCERIARDYIDAIRAFPGNER